MIQNLFSKIRRRRERSAAQCTATGGAGQYNPQSSRDALICSVSNHTMSSPDRLNKLIDLAEYCNRAGIAGDFVECGSYKGGSSAVLSRYLDKKRHLWIYDSFKGMPETTDKDGETARQCVGLCAATVQDVIEIMNTVGTEPSQYTITKGWFVDSFRKQLPDRVALLHCDADWYESVMLVLETFYDRVTDGGCIILDDFGFWEGCREAFYDFCFSRGEKPLIERLGDTQAYWIKGKHHNREGFIKGVKNADV